MNNKTVVLNASLVNYDGNIDFTQIASEVVIYEVEPLDDASPLYTMDNVIVTPHMGWRGLETRQRLVSLIQKNVRAFSNGQPINRV